MQICKNRVAPLDEDAPVGGNTSGIPADLRNGISFGDDAVDAVEDMSDEEALSIQNWAKKRNERIGNSDDIRASEIEGGENTVDVIDEEADEADESDCCNAPLEGGGDDKICSKCKEHADVATVEESHIVGMRNDNTLLEEAYSSMYTESSVVKLSMLPNDPKPPYGTLQKYINDNQLTDDIDEVMGTMYVTGSNGVEFTLSSGKVLVQPR